MRDLQNDPHVICLSETFIKKGHENYLKLSDYEMASIFCRDKQRGGTCILIKKGLSYKELPFVKTHTSVNTFEACGIELTNEKLIIICIYRTPQSDPYQFLSKLDNILHDIYKKYKTKTRIILTGDFNINTFKKGKITQVFHDIARSHNIDIHINEATRKSSCIDHILSNIPNAIARVLPLHLSDHETAQTLSFPLKFQTAKASIYYIYKRDNNLDNTHKFIECLQNLSWANIYMENDANKAFDCFLELICLFHNLCFPKVRVKIDLNKKTKQTWISKGLKQSSKTKRCLRYQYYKNKNQANKTKYTTYSTLLQKCINNAKRNANIKYIDRNDNKCKATWAVIKSEIHNMNPKDNIEHIKIDNTVLTKPEVIASAFNSHYVNCNPIQNNNTKCANKNLIANSMYLTPMSETEVRQQILSLNNTTSEGYDELSTKLIKSCVNEISGVLTYLINLSFSQGVFPNALKLSLVKPIFKKGDKSNMENYRPITLIPILSKVYEKCMYQRLISYCEKYNILNKQQFGFQKQKSTTLAIYSLLKTVLASINSKHLTTGLFFDLSKAFDLVSHDILLKKLESVGIRGLSLQWLSSYITDRQQRVVISKLDEKREMIFYSSEYKNVKCGVPQGSILGPILFIIYINDIINITNHKCILFADDISIIVTSDKKIKNVTDHETDINNTIDILINYLNNNNLSINLNKSVYIQFNKSYNDKFNFKMNIPKLTQVTQTKFLGIVLDEHLDWKAQVDHVCNKINKFAYALRQIKKVTSIKTAVMSYQAYVESCLRYGLIFWGNSTDQGRVFVAQKKCIRAIYGLPSDESCQPIFKKLGLLPLPSLYVYEVSMFVKKYIQLFKTIDEVNSRSRRDQHKHKLELEIIPRIVKYNKSCPAMCVCVFNKLPCVLKTLNCTLFKNKLYNLLSQNNFYSIKQFLDYRP